MCCKRAEQRSRVGNPTSSIQPQSSMSASASIARPKKKSTRKHAKSSSKPAAAASSSDAEVPFARNEGADAPLAYAPPAGSVPADIDLDLDFGEFDYDAVNADEGAELWLVRVPTAVHPVNAAIR